MAKKNSKKTMSDFRKKFRSKEVLQSSSESETDEEENTKDVSRNFVQGIINTSISSRGKFIINPHLKVVQNKWTINQPLLENNRPHLQEEQQFQLK